MRTSACTFTRRFAIVIAAVALVACGGTGTVHTSTGADVPASVVVSQDVVGDVLNALTDAQVAAVGVHDRTPICPAAGTPTVPCDTLAAHTAHRAALKKAAAGLRAGWDALAAWKVAASGAPAAGTFCAFGHVVPDFVQLAVELGVVKADAASKALGLAAALVAGGCA